MDISDDRVWLDTVNSIDRDEVRQMVRRAVTTTLLAADRVAR